MNILVVSAYEDRRKKYTDEYEIISAVWWEDIKDEELKTYHFYWNARDSHKKKVVACSKSHKKAIQHIIDNDLKNTIIIEDDAVLDLSRLDELKDYDDFVFVGGDIRPPLVKDDKIFNKSMINKSNGLNVIDTDTFRILGAFGYFIPNKKIAQMIIDMIPVNNKEKAIDVEFSKLQKKGIIKYFHFPPISTLYMPDALTGFNAKLMNLKDNFSEY